jgi:hypothetical protein
MSASDSVPSSTPTIDIRWISALVSSQLSIIIFEALFISTVNHIFHSILYKTAGKVKTNIRLMLLSVIIRLLVEINQKRNIVKLTYMQLFRYDLFVNDDHLIAIREFELRAFIYNLERFHTLTFCCKQKINGTYVSYPSSKVYRKKHVCDIIMYSLSQPIFLDYTRYLD